MTLEVKKKFSNIGKKLIRKIMNKLSLVTVGTRKFKKTTISDDKALKNPDLVVGHFKTKTVNELWTSDITYISTKEGCVYLCVILDTYSRKIIGWSMKDNMRK